MITTLNHLAMAPGSFSALGRFRCSLHSGFRAVSNAVAVFPRGKGFAPPGLGRPRLYRLGLHATADDFKADAGQTGAAPDDSQPPSYKVLETSEVVSLEESSTEPDSGSGPDQSGPLRQGGAQATTQEQCGPGFKLKVLSVSAAACPNLEARPRPERPGQYEEAGHAEVPHHEVGTEGCFEFELQSPRGPIRVREYDPPLTAAPALIRGVLLLSGVHRQWGTPGGDLYPRVARELRDRGVRVVHVCYREAPPASLEEALFDAEAALKLLTSRAVQSVALVGFGLGAAVALQLAEAYPGNVCGVAALSPQTYGAEPVRGLGRPGRPLLVVHGQDDPLVHWEQAKLLYDSGGGDAKRLVLLDRAGHFLDGSEGAREELHSALDAFLTAALEI